MRLLWAIVLGACSNGPKPFVDIDKDVDRWDEMGVPLIGDIAFKVTLRSPKDEYATATGTAMVGCTHCALGTPSSASGIEYPQIELGKIDGTATFKSGSGTVHLVAGDADVVEVELTGTLVLANKLGDSRPDLHLRFRPSEKLRETNPKIYTLLTVTGAARDDKGWFSIHITGTLSDTRRSAD